jgi:putative membrane protein
MKYILPALLAVLALGLLSSSSEARTRKHPAITQAAPPQKFIQKVADSNQFEIKSSQIALDKSKNDEIRRFAQRMIDDHTKIGDEFKAVLQQANLPQPSDNLNQQDRMVLAKLQNEKEPAFDRTYVASQRRGHQQAVQLLRNYSRSGGNKALKQLAAKTLPIIKEHLKMAEGLRAGRNLSARR